MTLDLPYCEFFQHVHEQICLLHSSQRPEPYKIFSYGKVLYGSGLGLLCIFTQNSSKEWIVVTSMSTFFAPKRVKETK